SASFQFPPISAPGRRARAFFRHRDAELQRRVRDAARRRLRNRSGALRPAVAQSARSRGRPRARGKGPRLTGARLMAQLTMRRGRDTAYRATDAVREALLVSLDIAGKAAGNRLRFTARGRRAEADCRQAGRALRRAL